MLPRYCAKHCPSSCLFWSNSSLRLASKAAWELFVLVQRSKLQWQGLGGKPRELLALPLNLKMNNVVFIFFFKGWKNKRGINLNWKVMGKPNSSLRFECKACPFARCAPCWASFACFNLAALVFCGFRGPDLTYVQKYTQPGLAGISARLVLPNLCGQASIVLVWISLTGEMCPALK